MFRQAFLCALSFALYCIAASVQPSAQAAEGTLYAKFAPIYGGGRLEGCSVEFRHFTQEHKYYGGKLLIIDGSVNIIHTDSTSATLLKIIPYTLNDDTNQLDETEYGPSRLFLIDKDGNTTVSGSLDTRPTETGRGLLSIFPMFPSTLILAEAAVSGPLVVGFNIGNGRSDILVSIDLTVKETTGEGVQMRALDNMNGLFSCIGALTKQAGGR